MICNVYKLILNKVIFILIGSDFEVK